MKYLCNQPMHPDFSPADKNHPKKRADSGGNLVTIYLISFPAKISPKKILRAFDKFCEPFFLIITPYLTIAWLRVVKLCERKLQVNSNARVPEFFCVIKKDSLFQEFGSLNSQRCSKSVRILSFKFPCPHLMQFP